MASKTYICDRTCYVKGIRHAEGVQLIVEDGDIVPCPECKGEGEKDNEPCRKCRGTGRSDPPHHFVPKDKKELEVKKEAKDEKQEIDDLRQEISVLGGSYHHKAGKAKLESQVILLRRGKNKEVKHSEEA